MKMRGRSFVIEIARVELTERLQRLAVAAADLVVPGMVVGLGTGSTADAVIRELGRRVADGLLFAAVPTSDRTEELARSLGIPLAMLDEIDRVDLGVDGADEIDPALDAIKGRGGALLREKLVALSCDDYVLVATPEKSVD
jgi:ribose 5-phosphate isomerase A